MAEDLRAFVKALPARLAALQAVLVAVGAWVVPLLPAPVAVKAAAVIAVGVAWLVAVANVVARVTLVPSSARGLTVPDATELVIAHRWKADPTTSDPIGYRVVR